MLFSQSVSSASISRVWGGRRGERFTPSSYPQLPFPRANQMRKGARKRLLLESARMSKQGVFVLLLFVSLLGSARLEGQLQHTSSRGPRSAGMHVAADLKGRLAKFREVQMPFQSADPTEKKVIAKLVEASRHLESIFWRQVDPE